MIYTYKDINPGTIVGPVDVCIIGSGAGGATMAYYLAKAGFSVVVLEKGGYFPSEELGRKEVAMLTRIEAMTIFTPVSGKHTRISLLTGECYGGGTVASESVTWDLPDVVLEDWVKMGLKSFSPTSQRIREYKKELNSLLMVSPVKEEHHNMCNWLLKLGAEREGLKWKSVARPVSHCMRCGNCTQGCRYGVKMDAANTFLNWAQDYKTDVYCGATATKITINYPTQDDFPYSERLNKAKGASRDDILRELEHRRKNAPAKFTISATVIDRKIPVKRDKVQEEKALTVHSNQVVLSAGPLGSSRLLMKSGINPNNVVGKRFTTHPTTFTLGRFSRNIMIKGWDGINDSIEVHHYADMNRNEPYYDPSRHGILFEAALSLPWGLANLLPGVGKEHLALMRDMNHFAGIEVNVKTDQYGVIKPDEVNFDISERDNDAMLFGTWLASRMFFRVGAKEVYTGLPGLVIKSPNQLDEIYKYRRGKAKGYMQKQANLYSGHVFGGCVMGVDPKSSFADETGECHQIKGLWVADGSVFPTNVGVNCCMSIMQVARKIADDFIAKTKEREKGV